MLNHSRELNMLACLLAALASGSFARFHCDVFHFFSTLCLHSLLFLHNVHFFYKLKEKGSLRCSFCFYVDSNRGTAQARNERRLSASRDIRSIRVPTTVPCQQHQRESLVSLFRAIVELSRYDDIIPGIYIYIFLAVPTPVRLLGLGNSQCLFRTIAKLSRNDGIVFFAVPAPALLFRAISLCTISVFIPIENPHLTIVHFGKTLRVYSTSH